MLRFVSVAVLLSFSTLLVGSCSRKSDPAASPAMSFQTDVLPVLSSYCGFAGCHGSSGGEAGALTTYDEVMNRGGIKPGDAHGSRLYRAITGHDVGNNMPPKGYAAPTEQDKVRIYLWIEQGALNN